MRPTRSHSTLLTAEVASIDQAHLFEEPDVVHVTAD